MSGIALVIITLGLLYAAVVRLAGSGGWWLTSLAILLISAQFLLVEQAVFGIPLRVLVVVICALSLAVRAVAFNRPIFRTREEMAISVAWMLYVVIALIALLANGSMNSAEDMVDFFSRYVVALVTFHLLLEASRRPGVGPTIAGWLFGIAVANIAFVVMQLLGVMWAFDVHDALFPLTARREETLRELGAITNFGFLPGLSAFSITTGYVIACFGALGLRGAFDGGGAARIGWSLVVLGLLFVGGLLILSRSTIAAVVLALLAVVGFGFRGRGRALVFLAAAAAVVLVGAGLLFAEATIAQLLPQLNRLVHVTDSARVGLLVSVIEYVGQYPFFGGYGRAIASGAIDKGAHSLLGNALLYFGLVGSTAVVVMLVVTAWGLLRTLERTRPGSERGLAIACGVGIVAYTFKSLFHNESVVTSGIIYMLLLGLAMGVAYAGNEGAQGSA